MNASKKMRELNQNRKVKTLSYRQGQMFLMFLYQSDEEGISKGLEAKNWQNLLL